MTNVRWVHLYAFAGIYLVWGPVACGVAMLSISALALLAYFISDVLKK